MKYRILLAARWSVCLALVGASWIPDAAHAEIKDNSFFIEEAYNQEEGVIQHIFNWVPQWDRVGNVRTLDFAFTFTQEWPLGSELHQFSYTIPLLSNSATVGNAPAATQSGVGDILLNYRYQLLDDKETNWAIAPRFTLSLPSGVEDLGLVNGIDLGLGQRVVGYVFNLPISHQAESFAYHFNAGFSIYPNTSVGAEKLTPVDYNLGASAIYTVSDKFQPLVELVAQWNSEGNLAGTGLDHEFEIFISPGFRWAIYEQGEAQTVIGAAVPIGLNREAPDIGVFIYFSVEHPLACKKHEEASGCPTCAPSSPMAGVPCTTCGK